MAGKIKIVCSKCGSENVLRDAYAAWDVDAQEWALSSTYDEFKCDDCGWDGFDEVPLEETPEHTCKFCGSPSAVDPSDQAPPADYCHPSDHGDTDAQV